MMEGQLALIMMAPAVWGDERARPRSQTNAICHPAREKRRPGLSGKTGQIRKRRSNPPGLLRLPAGAML